MNPHSFKIVFVGLSITSSWGNGHATTYRGLVRGLAARGHSVLFLERDMPWYAANRDLPMPPFGRTELYRSLQGLKDRFAHEIRDADFVVVGSYVPQGSAVGEWVLQTTRGVTAFYDIDTPVTLAGLASGDLDYLSPALIPRYDLYLSFTGGPTLSRIENEYGARKARTLYCSVDPSCHYPEKGELRWDLGYLGTYSQDRQPRLESLLIEPSRRWRSGRFAVAGPQYPTTVRWPENVHRIDHVPPVEHRAFFNAQRFTLNITREDMVRAGYSPSVRLFEAAACGTPIISDDWEGIDSFFERGKEILIATSPEETLEYLKGMREEDRIAVSERARNRVLTEHTASRRVAELEGYIIEALHGVNRAS